MLGNNNLFLIFMEVFPGYIAMAAVSIYLVGCFITDSTKGKIYDKWNMAFLILRVLAIPLIPLTLSQFISAVAIFLIFLIPSMLMKHSSGGDIKMGAVLGLWLGYYSFYLFALAFVLGIILVQYYFYCKNRITIPVGVTVATAHFILLILIIVGLK